MADHTTEIERKWLIKDLPNLGDCKKVKIIQGYIVASAKGEVRLRQKGARFFQTVKTGTGLEQRQGKRFTVHPVAVLAPTRKS